MPPDPLGSKETELPVAQLTARMNRGDEAAWEEFHRRYFSRLLAYLLVLHGGNEDIARDSLQQTYLRIVKHVRRFDQEEVWWSWLTRVARSVAIDGSRKNTRYTGLLEQMTLSIELRREEHREPGLLATVLDECLARLHPDERSLLERKYVEQWTCNELAESLGSTPKSVESRLARMRKTLKHCIQERLRHV